MKSLRSTVTVLAAATLITALAGCTSLTGLPTAATHTASPTPTPVAATYTADGLTGILTSVNTTLALNGKVLDDTAVKSAAAQAGGAGGLGALLSGHGVTFSPAACSSLITSALSTTPPAGAIGAALTWGTSSISLSSVAGGTLPATLKSQAADRTNALLSQCSTMTITVAAAGTSVTIALTVEKFDVTSDADSTSGVRETVTLPPLGGTQQKPVTIDVLQATQGNLLINAFGQESTTAPTLVDAVNAVVAASKK